MANITNYSSIIVYIELINQLTTGEVTWSFIQTIAETIRSLPHLEGSQVYHMFSNIKTQTVQEKGKSPFFSELVSTFLALFSELF